MTCLLAGGFAAGAFARAFLAYSRAKVEALVEKRHGQDEKEVMRLVERACRSDTELGLSAATARDILTIGFALLAFRHAGGAAAPDGSLARAVAPWVAAWVVVVGVLARTVGANFAEGIVYWLGGVARVALLPVRPLGLFILFGGKMVDRMRGKREPESEEEEIEDEIRAIVAEGTTGGVLERDEGEMIESVLRLGDADVAEIMTPRTDMVSISVSAALDEAVTVATDSGHSRLPVYGENRDDIVGVLYVKDLLRHWGKASPPALKDVIRKPHFIPESREVSGLLEDMQKEGAHIAIVLDEYGGTSGLVTVEDIVEEIVGEIKDEYDRRGEPTWTEMGEGALDSDARVHVDDINKALGVDLPEAEDYDTVGGLVISLIGRIPRTGEKVRSSGVEFEVLDADARRVKRLRIARVQDEE
ncbi:MAG: hemolysin family protein [Planctomycetota bacterium]